MTTGEINKNKERLTRISITWIEVTFKKYKENYYDFLFLVYLSN